MLWSKWDASFYLVWLYTLWTQTILLSFVYYYWQYLLLSHSNSIKLCLFPVHSPITVKWFCISSSAFMCTWKILGWRYKEKISPFLWLYSTYNWIMRETIHDHFTFHFKHARDTPSSRSFPVCVVYWAQCLRLRSMLCLTLLSFNLQEDNVANSSPSLGVFLLLCQMVNRYLLCNLLCT